MKRFSEIGSLLLWPCLLLLSLGVPETRADDAQKVVMDKAIVESMMRIMAQTASNLENVNDIVSSAACAPLVFESGKNPESGNSAGSLSRESLDRLRLCLASLQVALAQGRQAEGDLEEDLPLPSNRKCLDVSGSYKCSGGFETYISFSKGTDGFIYDMEYDDGTLYQYIADDKIHSVSEGQYIASCRRKFVRIAFPTTEFPATEEDKEKHKGKDIYSVEEYTLWKGDLYIDIYYADITEGNINSLKRLENYKGFSCEKL